MRGFIMKLTIASFFILILFVGSKEGHSKPSASVAEKINKLQTTKFSINFENTSLRPAFKLIAMKAGLHLEIDENVNGTINYSFSNVTLAQALEQIMMEQDLNYQVSNSGVLSVGLGWTGGRNERAPASQGHGKVKMIYLKYLTASDASRKVKNLIGKDEKVIVDGPTNSIAFFGSNKNFLVIKEAIRLFDKMPPQILIEANIVEINKNTARAFGISYGDLTDPSLSNTTGSGISINNKEPDSPNLVVKIGLGNLDGNTLSARLALAESEGEAKVLSRPKIVTINNKTATINSGISFSVKTLSSVSSGDSSGSSGDNATGGITTVTAGLTLSVTPTIVGDGLVKLLINVTNSEPDLSTLVDGIPGIVSNTARTEIIVADGKTASVAGLVKNNFSDSESGVPYLSKLPFIGWLFKSNTKSGRDMELMIFITPRILKTGLSGNYMNSSEELLPDSEKPIKEPSKSPTTKDSTTQKLSSKT